MAVILAYHIARPQIPQSRYMIATGGDQVTGIGTKCGIPHPFVIFQCFGQFPCGGIPQFGRPITPRRDQMSTICAQSESRKKIMTKNPI